MTHFDKIISYPYTDQFAVVDITFIPHPYVLTGKHIEYISLWYSGHLCEATIESAELLGCKCGYPGCTLKIDQHLPALIVHCETKDVDAIKAYCDSISDKCNADGFAGMVAVTDF